MAFGARMFKTGLAVTLALYMAMLLDFKSPVVAAIAAIFAMQPSIYRSWRYFLDQLQTSTLERFWPCLAAISCPISRSRSA